jgi:phage terminase large subunit
LENNKYLYSKAYFKILNLIKDNPDEDVFVVCGGQGAGKTISILELFIQALLSESQEATVLSSELSKMKRTVIRDYVKICNDWGVIHEITDFNRSESKHEYNNGSYIDFLGADSSDVGKGFRRDLLYINEADKLEVDQAVQFISRAKLTIIDYNPDNIFWGDDFINDNNFLILTFEDNEFLSEQERKSILDYKTRGFINPELPFEELFSEANIKSKYWANKWRVYGLGLVGRIDGVVFDNYDVIQTIPEEAKLVYYGCDFGFSVSKLAVVSVYKLNDRFILNEEVYSNEKTNDEVIMLFNYNNPTPMYCDYAEPKSIRELQMSGINAVPCESKTDIKKHAIQKLHQNNFSVTSKSLNLIDELRVFKYNKTTGLPQKNNQDHLIDAMLYAVGSGEGWNWNYL